MKQKQPKQKQPKQIIMPFCNKWKKSRKHDDSGFPNNLRRIKMIKKIFAVYDKKAKSEMSIFEMPNELVAMRDFSQACNNDKSMISKFPEDYALACLGTINTETMEITSEVKFIAEAKDYVNVTDKQ